MKIVLVRKEQDEDGQPTEKVLHTYTTYTSSASLSLEQRAKLSAEAILDYARTVANDAKIKVLFGD